MFDKIKGQDKALRFLENAIKHNRVSQAYIFYGPEGVGKFTTALYFGMALNCQSEVETRPCGTCSSCHKFLEFSHPDLIYIFPTPSIKTSDEGELKNKSISEYLSYIEKRKTTPWEKVYFTQNTEIRKESMEILQKQLESAQRESKYRICIIEETDEMNDKTTNSFLKTLEEPLPDTVFILLTTKLQSLLQTVLSRCQLVFFKPLTYKIIEDILTSDFLIDKQLARTYSRIANGNLEQAIRLTNDVKHESRNLMIQLLEAAIQKDDSYVINNLQATKEKFKVELMHDLLDHLALWFSDLALLKTGRRDVVNLDFEPLLEQYADKLSAKDSIIAEFLMYFDDLHRKVDGKVNVQFILIDLYHKIKLMLIP
jgi:DNA polymerase III subunit delta'